jgi:hypothetical protein
MGGHDSVHPAPIAAWKVIAPIARVVLGSVKAGGGEMGIDRGVPMPWKMFNSS